MRAHPHSTYVRAGPRAWALMREAYLSGLSAPTVAARFGVSEAALRKRARREGWTKTAAAGTRPLTVGPPLPHHRDPAGGEDRVVAAYAIPRTIHPERLARESLARAAAALRAGEGLEAMRLARAAQMIAHLDDTLWRGDEDEPIDDDGREALLRDYVRAIAVGIALRLARGEPMPEEYADLVPDYAAALAGDAQSDGPARG
jgi:hypothetical protein